MKYKVAKVKALPNLWLAVNFQDVDDKNNKDNKVYKLYDVNLFAENDKRFLAFENNEKLFRTVNTDKNRDGIVWGNGLNLPLSELWEKGIGLFNANKLWNCDNEDEWKNALMYYWALIKEENIKVERRMHKIKRFEVQDFSYQQFYDFLCNEYYEWKYTAGNRLARNKKLLQENHCDSIGYDILMSVKRKIFELNHNNIEMCLNNICKKSRTSGIYGLGVAGASGLLAILFPERFGTVDQFIVSSLQSIKVLSEEAKLHSIKNPESLTVKEATMLIKLMRNKAKELNEKFDTDFWTPRKIDMILWSIGRDIQ